MSFQDRVAEDLDRVFLNPRFFGEVRTVRYNGEEYPDIPVSLQRIGQKERQRKADDHAPGFYRAGAVLFCACASLGGAVPEKGMGLEISDRENPEFFEAYRVAASSREMEMLRIELEVAGQ